ncbi:Hypothetical protein UVM_LOCUS497 [uncultured virus]|nr:Hypothetical protein UVM_LOCUS497 [uncultured virus]
MKQQQKVTAAAEDLNQRYQRARENLHAAYAEATRERQSHTMVLLTAPPPRRTIAPFKKQRTGRRPVKIITQRIRILGEELERTIVIPIGKPSVAQRLSETMKTMKRNSGSHRQGQTILASRPDC